MTAPFDAPRYQRALERWRSLAEQRLAHLTVLYDSGRWRRYFNEETFLRHIRETRVAVDAWRKLAPGQQAPTAQLLVLPGEPVAARTPSLPSPFAEPGVQRSVA